MKLDTQRLAKPNRLQDRLFAGLKDEPLNFLTSSAGLVRLISRAGQEDCTIEEAVRLIHNEPLVAAKLVAMANSAAYSRSDRPITNVKDALGLLGLGILKAIASAVVVGQLAEKAAKVNAAAVSQLWTHSIEVAALAALISRRFTRDPPETALFAGMVHEIAGFFILSRAHEVVDLTGGDVLDAVRGEAASHEEASDSLMAVGTRRLLSALQMPDEIADAIACQWRGYVMLPPESLGDTILIANLMAATSSPFDGPDSRADAPRLDLDEVLDRSEVAAAVREAYEEVRSVQQAFNQRAAA